MLNRTFLAWLAAAALWQTAAADPARLLRFPAIHGDQLVFSYAGDLYTVASAGGVARRLTSDDGYEMFARFSPDGSQLAFTAQYDGNTEVYSMPSAGGVPTRLTFTATLDRDDVSDRMGPNNIVMTWRDPQRIVFRSRRNEKNDFIGQLFYAPVAGGLPEQLPLPRGGWCSFSPDEKKIAYNRVFREFRTWKRYRGGQADEIWIYDFETKGITNITQNAAQDIFPMWRGDHIYFISDRDENKRMNLFAYETATATTQQLTRFTEFDIKFPSLGDHAIVFENGGFIYRFDLASGEAVQVPIQIQEDLVSGRGGLKDVSREITTYDLAPDGKRAVFGSRGEVFTLPLKHGNTRNLTGTSGVHERNPVWSPDGQWIAYVSDATGEDEIYMQRQDGSQAPVQLSREADTYKYNLLWSPDSRKILWSDKKLRLAFIDVSTKETTLVTQASAWEITDFVWSPDGQWIAYQKPEERQMARIYLYSLASKESTPVTDGWFASSDPAFSSDGKFLFFVSNRNYTPRYSETEWNHAYFDMAGLYLLTLAADTKSPFAPQSDEVAAQPESAKKEDKPSEKRTEVKVTLEGISQRITSLPVAASRYSNLHSVGDKLFYRRHGTRDEKPKLFLFDFEKHKETELGDFNGFTLSADKKKMMVSTGDSYAIVDLPGAKIEVKEKLNLSDLKVFLDRRAEWHQIYRECWRQIRDFVYAPNLHGVDWPKIRERYEPLVAHVQHRADLTYVIGEMVAELNLGHTYVGGGDYPKPDRVKVGLLGARIERDASTGYFKIVKILKGQNWDKNLRSPLTEIGVRVKEGDYIIAVNGKPCNEMIDLYASLVNWADKQVTLTVNSEPQAAGSHDTIVVPTGDERLLYYFNWVQKNIDRVSAATEGRIGYVHIPDMGAAGLNEFVKYFYPQTHKEGVIVDVRGNGGGNVSPQIIERLRREPAMVTVARNSGLNVDPSGAILGPKVMLIDEFSASDGDIVAYRFKKYKLGPVIGKRTWGGVVGIRGTLPLLDGGFINRPEFSRYDLEGREWIMEGIGVEPDVFIDNDPAREFAGTDDQLEKAIELIQEELKKHPVKLPPPPAYPTR